MIMIPWYGAVGAFAGGVFLGFLLMGLMVASSESRNSAKNKDEWR